MKLSHSRLFDSPRYPRAHPARNSIRLALVLVIGATALAPSSALYADDPAADSDSQPAAASKSPGKPQLEIFIPSLSDLVCAARASKTASLLHALSGLMPSLDDETGEGLDAAALSALVEKMAAWPDTSLTLATYTLDPEGRPRWAIAIDWPAAQLAARMEELLADEAAQQLLKNIELKKTASATWQLELPDLVLAVILKAGDGSMIASHESIELPDEIFGRKQASEARGKDRTVPVLYCNLNLEAGDENEKASSAFGSFVAVSGVQYWITALDDGRWREDFAASWNPLLGLGLKAVFQKADKQYPCPKKALFAAVVNLGTMTSGLPDGMTGLPAGTLAPHVRGDLAISVTPGTGFLPFPDIFMQFRSAPSEYIYEDIREFIEKDNERRRDEDDPPAWREFSVDAHPAFWRDPTADIRGAMLSPATYRTVLFVQEREEGDAKVSHLVIAQTSGTPEEAVRRWAELTASGETVTLPSSKKIHWQARINWKELYTLAQPYLGLAAAFTQGTTLPPEAAELDDALADGVIDLNISFGGVRVRHRGPVPVGMAYVPAVAAMSFTATADAGSEAAREQTAARHLRVLHHHSRLFQKDYGRWPATVAELDGYVDFASHPHLLHLAKQDKSFLEDFAASVFGASGPQPASKSDDDDADDESNIDDSLYVITWSGGHDWRLSIREGEFRNYKTIYIDSDGNIHRVPLNRSAATDQSKPVANTDKKARDDSKPGDAKDAGRKKEVEKKPEEKEPKPRKKPILL